MSEAEEAPSDDVEEEVRGVRPRSNTRVGQKVAVDGHFLTTAWIRFAYEMNDGAGLSLKIEERSPSEWRL